jgi:hypothetical protein
MAMVFAPMVLVVVFAVGEQELHEPTVVASLPLPLQHDHRHCVVATAMRFSCDGVVDAVDALW